MGNGHSEYKLANYEDVQKALTQTDKYIINTMQIHEQQCLIAQTLSATHEESTVNKLLSSRERDIRIIVYGKNCTDKSVFKTATQLSNLGFTNVFIYMGGLFEWLLLQDIYGNEFFPTTSKELDILKYKSQKAIYLP